MRRISGTDRLSIAASEYGHTEIVAMLLDAGADVNAKHKWGSTALQLASDNGHTEIVKLLKKAMGIKAMGIKEENFIVDKLFEHHCICKEATYFDPMEGTEVTRDIKEYLQEDKDNIMLIYQSNKK